MKDKIIEMKSVNVFFRKGNLFSGKKYIINDFSLSIDKGEIIGLSGVSGIGKTTLGKSILNLHKYWEGDILWEGKNIRKDNIKPIRHLFNWIGQEPSMTFNPVKNIYSVLFETLKNQKIIDNKQIKMKISESFERYNMDKALLNRYPHELSAGQIQRLALIRILLLKPKFIILDEPVSSLDPINQELFLDNFLNFHRQFGFSAIFISHSKNFLKRICSNIIELSSDWKNHES